MWFAALFNGKNGSMFRNVIYIGLIVTFLVIFTIVIVNKSKKNKKDKEDERIIGQYENEVQPEKLTFSESEYNTMANGLFKAMDGIGTDEAAIYQVFQKLRTNSDVLKLQAAFGIRNDMDLFEYIRDDMNNNDIAKLNGYLAQHNISIRIS